MRTASRRPHVRLTLRPATLADVPTLDRWDRDPNVIAASSDDPDALKAFGDLYWPEELAMQSDVYEYFIAELDGRPIGAMQIIDPHLEPTHYWGEIEPNLRAMDIWIGDPADRGQGHGAEMMRLALERCFADPRVTAIVIDPLARNTRAHQFYRRLGFEATGRQRFGEDDCLVHKLTRRQWEVARDRLRSQMSPQP
jgi:aminoglycoside 6'-N-acetyltransferase